MSFYAAFATFLGKFRSDIEAVSALLFGFPGLGVVDPGIFRRGFSGGFVDRLLNDRFLDLRQLHLAFQQDAANAGDRFLHLLTRHDHVDHAMVQKVLGRLKVFRELLANRLLDYPPAGKADLCTRFGDMDVAEHGIGSRHAACGRVVSTTI